MTNATVLAYHNPPTLQASPVVHGPGRLCLLDEHGEALTQTSAVKAALVGQGTPLGFWQFFQREQRR